MTPHLLRKRETPTKGDSSEDLVPNDHNLNSILNKPTSHFNLNCDSFKLVIHNISCIVYSEKSHSE